MRRQFVRTANALSAGYSFLKSSITGNPVIHGMPVFLSVEITNRCNLHCPECASGSGLMRRGRGFMDLTLYQRITDELKPYIYYLNLYFQGEPMLHPDFFSFLEPVRGIPSLVSTNGHFLTAENSEKLVRSGLGKLIVSLDGMDEDTYLIYRKGGDFHRVLDGIKNVADARGKYKSAMKLEIQFLVNRYNENQKEKLRQFAKETGASVKFKSMQVINCRDAAKWMPEEKRYRRYIERKEGYVIKSRMAGRCARLWMNPVITWDGKVIPCCFDKDGEYVMGDLMADTFADIWNGQQYLAFRKKVLEGRGNIDICRNCTSGLRGVKC